MSAHLRRPLDVEAVAGVGRDADARREVEKQPVEVDRLLDGGAHAANDLENLRPAGLRHEHRELVAAEPGDRVAFAQSLLQASPGLLQYLVARHVAKRVVDLLEPVQVEYEDGELTMVLLRLEDRLGDALVKKGAIREPGERVVQSLVAQLALDDLARLLRRLLPGDVHDHADGLVPSAVRSENGPAVLGNPPCLPAHMQHPVFERVRRSPLEGVV